MEETWDCIIIGGGAAGLSAALVLGRARRRTLVIDAGEQSNRSAHGVGGLLGHDRRPPADLYAAGREEATAYPGVEVRDGTVTAVETNGGAGFDVQISDGTRVSARKLVLASGMDYRIAELEGLDELWGNSVFHCPFCHGWEARDGALAVRNNGGHGVHAALLLRNWSDDVILLTDGPAELEEDQRQLLDRAGVPVDERPVAALRQVAGTLAAVVFADGTELARDGLMVAPRLHQRSDLARQLGVELTPASPMLEDAVATDSFQRSTVPGVFVAGDVSGEKQQVSTAVSSGSNTAAMVVMSLVSEDFGLPLPPAMTGE